MPGKISSKLKGMIFADRPTLRSGRASTKDDAQTGLIHDGPAAQCDGPGTSTGSPRAAGEDQKKPPQKTRGSTKHRLHWQKGYVRTDSVEEDPTTHVRVWDDLMGEAWPATTNRSGPWRPARTTTRPLGKARSWATPAGDERVLLNVGSVRHADPHVTTLKNIPNSRLSRLAALHVSSGKGKQEYFFDRHPAVFNSIIDFYRTGQVGQDCLVIVSYIVDFYRTGRPCLFGHCIVSYIIDFYRTGQVGQACWSLCLTSLTSTGQVGQACLVIVSYIVDFYRTGELHVPLEVCGAVVKRELDFWQIEELQIKACCWRHYRSYIENQRILNSFNKSLEHEQMKIDLSSLTGWKHIQMKLWLIMDHPRTSRMAMVSTECQVNGAHVDGLVQARAISLKCGSKKSRAENSRLRSNNLTGRSFAKFELVSVTMFGLVSVTMFGLVSVAMFGLVSVTMFGLVGVTMFGLVSVTMFGLVSVTMFGLVSVTMFGLVSVTMVGLVSVTMFGVMYGITSFLFVSASIAGFCLETLPSLRPQETNVTNGTCFYADDNKTIYVEHKSNDALNVLDFICTVFFTLELVMRFLVSPKKLRFIRNIMNIIDLLALVPLYVQVIFEQSNLHQNCYLNERFVFEIMFTLRIFRMFRIFHLVKHYQALKVLVYSLKASLQELMMLFIFLLLATLIFATMIYYAERDFLTGGRTQFTTIPIGFWWAIITMTTVGYGDVAPSTPIGYIVGTICAVCGVLFMALTFPVISNNFTLFYEHVRSRSLSPRTKTIKQEIESDEDEDEEDAEEAYMPKQPPDYGSVLLKMQTMSSVNNKGAGVSNGSTSAVTATSVTMTTDSNGDRVKQKQGSEVKTCYVPLAKFSDNSSMMDIILQEPTGELFGANYKPLAQNN
ncbi:hypothetical protein Btru_062515 [Bulinus truncatus]|nr:hypothetical protein Btru_062515 [Bulinus truncatus]